MFICYISGNFFRNFTILFRNLQRRDRSNDGGNDDNILNNCPRGELGRNMLLWKFEPPGFINFTLLVTVFNVFIK